MKSLTDARLVTSISVDQRGVFSTDDLRTVLADRHRPSFARRVDRLLDAGVLRRFARGWYIAEEFDLPTLSQRLAPSSCISFGNVLADHLLIGTRPERQVMAVRAGRGRTYKAKGFEIVHLGLAESLFFAIEVRDGVRYAEPEKAVVDTFYYHLRGQRYVFDPFSDIDVSRLDRRRLERYLGRYRNPKFRSFVRNWLEGV